MTTSPVKTRRPQLGQASPCARALGVATLCATATLLPAGAFAQAAGDWQFGALLYGYFPKLTGKTSFPGGPGSGGSGSDISVEPQDLISGLKFVFMGSLEARKGRWGAFTDILYLDLGGSESKTRSMTIGNSSLPATATVDMSLDMKGTIWTLGGMYRLTSEPTASMDLLFGARMADVEQTLKYQLNGDIGSLPISRDGQRKVSQKNWDAIVGVKGRVAFGADNKWFAPYYVDVGTGDSDLTWQAMGGVGYSFKWGELIGAWRYLDYRMGSDKPIQDMTFNGPMIAAAWRW